MPRPDPLGLTACPECDFPDAEVRNDKKGNPYRFCPDCSSQYFARKPHQQKALLAKMRPCQAAAPAKAPAAAPAAPRKPSTCLLDQ